MNNQRLLIFVVIFAVAFLGLTQFKNQLIKKSSNENSNFPAIVTGEGNPGTISIYKKEGDRFTKQSIDSGFRFVYTVRIGDARNEGRNRLYAGVSNSFFGKNFDCQVLEFDPQDNFKKTVVDIVGDFRCKDLAIGDAYNTGENELVLGTHGSGIINTYTFNKEKNSWDKTQVDKNYVASFDSSNNLNHKVPANLLPFEATVQTAVHTVRIGDVDNDGKNEIMATTSDPLENPEKNHVLFLRVYRFVKNIWKGETIDTLESNTTPFKATMDVKDLNGDGKNEVLVSASHHRLLVYKFNNGKWDKQVIDEEIGGVEDNMKGVSVAKFSPDKESIILATGITQAAVYKYDLVQDGKYGKKLIANLSDLLAKYKSYKGITENSLDAKAYDINNDGKPEIIVSGEQDTGVLAEQFNAPKFGWEGTTIGYTAVLSQKEDGSFQNNFIDFRSALALDVGKF